MSVKNQNSASMCMSDNKLFRVMLADDEEVILEGMSRMFDWAGNGFDVVATACDGEDAVRLARLLRPHILILDINMPILNGLEVVRILSNEYPDMRFIIASGYNEYAYLREALKLNVADYILKPVDFQELKQVLDSLRLQIINGMDAADLARVDSPEQGKVISDILAYINDNYTQPLSLKSIAEHFHMSPSYLSGYFKDSTSLNFYKYMTQLRLTKAQQLLRTSDYTVTEITEKTGFTDYRVFTKAFKKNVGLTPSKYRTSKR